MSRGFIPSKLAPLGRLALVTGASEGIGRETAIALAELGFDLALVARDQIRLNELADHLSHVYRVSVSIIAADLSTETGQLAVLDMIGTAKPKLAVLAAGFGSSGDFVEQDITSETAMVMVNCMAILRQTHALAREMVDNKVGQIILFGSLVGFQGCANSANYAATKAYVQSLAEGLAIELAPFGVKVLSVAPGPVKSGFAGRAGLQMSMASTPKIVARCIVKSLNSSGTIRPGFLSKFLGFSLATAPRFIRVRILSSIMVGMALRR